MNANQDWKPGQEGSYAEYKSVETMQTFYTSCGCLFTSSLKSNRQKDKAEVYW